MIIGELKMICKICGNETNGDAKFCNYCGSPLEQLNETSRQKKFCRKCGNELSDNSMFCRRCGERVVTTDDHSCENDSITAQLNSNVVLGQSAAVKKKSSKKIIFTAAAIIGAAIIVIAVMFFTKLTQRDDKKIVNAFENTFGAENYKCTLTCYPIDDDGFDPDEKHIAYIEKCYDKSKKSDQYYFDSYYVDSDQESAHYKTAYIAGELYAYDTYTKKFVYVDSQNDESRKNSKKVMEKGLYSIITTRNNFLNDYLLYDDIFFQQKYILSSNAVPALEKILEKYFEEGKSDCIKEYTKDGDKYSFKVDYSKLIKTVDVDYGKQVKKSVIDIFSHFEDSEKIKYTLNVDFTIKNNYVEKLDITSVGELNNYYAKFGKWSYKFESVNKLNSENSKIDKIKIITNEEIRLGELKTANANAKIAYNALQGVLADWETQGANIDDIKIVLLNNISFHTYEDYDEYYKYNYSYDEDDEYDNDDNDNYSYEKSYIINEVNDAIKDDVNGYVYIGTYDDNGKILFYVQFSKKIDNNVVGLRNPVPSKETIIGQYPNPNTDDKIYTWGKYNN